MSLHRACCCGGGEPWPTVTCLANLWLGDALGYFCGGTPPEILIDRERLQDPLAPIQPGLFAFRNTNRAELTGTAPGWSPGEFVGVYDGVVVFVAGNGLDLGGASDRAAVESELGLSGYQHRGWLPMGAVLGPAGSIDIWALRARNESEQIVGNPFTRSSALRWPTPRFRFDVGLRVWSDLDCLMQSVPPLQHCGHYESTSQDETTSQDVSVYCDTTQPNRSWLIGYNVTLNVSGGSSGPRSRHESEEMVLTRVRDGVYRPSGFVGPPDCIGYGANRPPAMNLDNFVGMGGRANHGGCCG